VQVQSDHYEDFYAPELEKHGYTGVYKKKTGEVRFSSFFTTGVSLSSAIVD
jgi:CCR4-NOT transcription complex subunit 6